MFSELGSAPRPSAGEEPQATLGCPVLGIDPRIGSGADQAATLLRAAEKINETRTDVALNLITRSLGDRPIQGARVTVGRRTPHRRTAPS
ncbi:hypothetical protein [Streptomyces olindensis]|uniref:hypothetical protein n=1 Tax=Streptomyces olindensis TaxID=358823 RepID=UPI0033F263F9